MFCKICGTQNDQNALHCVRCGTSLAPAAPPQQAPPPQWQNPAGQPLQGYYPPPQPQAPYGIPVNRPVNVENYFVQSILITVLCCLPLGIAAIVKSRDVDKMLAMGNIQGAMDASKTVKTLCWVGLGGGALFTMIVFFVSLASSLH